MSDPNVTNDVYGNSHYLNATQAKLVRAGWRLEKIRKRGMLKIVTWIHPDTCEAWPQRVALDIERLNEKSREKACTE